MGQLKKKIIINGKIELKTGLHIGGTNSAMSIGGPDSFVIRNPLDNKPYIPGSSLKGKMRSLFEISKGKIDYHSNKIENGPCKDINFIGVKLFGSASGDKTQRPSKLIVRDCALIVDKEEDIFTNTDLPFTESKTEVVIDRITAQADPRQIERVPAGAEFKLNLIINIFDNDNEKELVEATFSALKLVQDDYIGGSGSRGYGQVQFHIDSMVEREMDYYHKEGVKEKSITDKYEKLIDML